MTPTVSVIIPCYDAEAYLPRTLESVRRQTLPEWEVIVVDDGSPGDFEGAMAGFDGDPRIRVLRRGNGGQCVARNAGVDLASHSPYLLFLDADDLLEPEMLEVLVRELESNPGAGMAFCDRTLIDGEGRLIDSLRDDRIRRYVPDGRRVRLLGPDEPATPFTAFFAYSITVPSITLLRRSVFEAAGRWDQALDHRDDTDMWLRVTLRSEARHVPRRLVARRLHGRQLTRSAEAAVKRRTSLQKFERKWRDTGWLSPAERLTVEEARRFRDRRLLPHLWMGWGGERLRRGEPLEAARCWLRAARLYFWPGRLTAKAG